MVEQRYRGFTGRIRLFDPEQYAIGLLVHFKHPEQAAVVFLADHLPRAALCFQRAAGMQHKAIAPVVLQRIAS